MCGFLEWEEKIRKEGLIALGIRGEGQIFLGLEIGED